MTSKAFHDRDGFIWMNGEMTPWREAKVHFLTHGLHYGTTVFEGERAYNGRIFESRAHAERLHKSGAIINMAMPFSVDEIEAAKQDVMKANNLTDAYIRVAAWRGSEQMGIDVSGTKVHIGIAAWQWGSYFPPEIREQGIALATSQWRRPAPETAPTDSKCAALYALGTMAKHEAKEKGYNDALMLDHEGYVAESTGANLFAVKDGALFTPIADRFLNGITRRNVIALARDFGITVEEKRISPGELADFEEIFLTGTAAEITPVGKIDGHAYKVGPVTRKLTSGYEALVRAP